MLVKKSPRLSGGRIEWRAVTKLTIIAVKRLIKLHEKLSFHRRDERQPIRQYFYVFTAELYNRTYNLTVILLPILHARIIAHFTPLTSSNYNMIMTPAWWWWWRYSSMHILNLFGNCRYLCKTCSKSYRWLEVDDMVLVHGCMYVEKFQEPLYTTMDEIHKRHSCYKLCNRWVDIEATLTL